MKNQRIVNSFTNQIENKQQKAELILLKDESWKIGKQHKLKYLIKAQPNWNNRLSDDPDDWLVSFSELSTKAPEKSKARINKEKINLYNNKYFKHNNRKDNQGNY